METLLKGIGLTGYNPTGAFSFEFFNADTAWNKIPTGVNIFFMLAPESQTIQEGYKVKVTKTFDGAWVDDFGNDVKKISIKGSLYSFYFGSPKTNAFIDGIFDLSALNAFTGNYGISEFFKLRWIVSRIRDAGSNLIPDSNYNEAMIVGQDFPSIVAMNSWITGRNATGRRPHEIISCVYHDYDDNNHFDVVFDGFECSRDKSDPYTVNYSISMIGLSSVYAGFNKPSAFNKIIRGGLKETASQFTNDLNRSVTDVISNVNDVMNQVGSSAIKSILSSALGTVTNLSNQLSSLVNGVTNNVNYASVGAYATTAAQSLWQQQYQLQTLGAGVSPESIKAENSEVPLNKDIAKSMSAIHKAISASEQVMSLTTYSQNTIPSSRVLQTQTGVIDSSQFGSTADSSASSQGKDFSVLWYQVKQGDTLATIASNLLGSESYAAVIGDLNGLVASSFENNNLVGQKIKIPSTDLSAASSDDNNVYFNITKNDSSALIQEKVNGSDVSLNDSREGGVDSSGDLSVAKGVDCFTQNVMDSVTLKQGTIAELLPGYGIALSIGDVPNEYSQQLILRGIVQAIMSDPRAQSATPRANTFKMVGDTVSVEFDIVPINGKEFSQVITTKII